MYVPPRRFWAIYFFRFSSLLTFFSAPAAVLSPLIFIQYYYNIYYTGLRTLRRAWGARNRFASALARRWNFKLAASRTARRLTAGPGSGHGPPATCRRTRVNNKWRIRRFAFVRRERAVKFSRIVREAIGFFFFSLKRFLNSSFRQFTLELCVHQRVRNNSLILIEKKKKKNN